MNKLFALIALLPASAFGQYAASASASTTAAGEINSKIAWQTSAGTPVSNCTAGKDLDLDVTNFIQYFCKATNVWAVNPQPALAGDVTGAIGSNVISTAVTVVTPVAGVATYGSAAGVNEFDLTLTANVTSSICPTNAKAGKVYNFVWSQNGTGNFTMVAPTGGCIFSNAPTMPTEANSSVSFGARYDGANFDVVYAAVNTSGHGICTESAAPVANPVSGGYPFCSSVDHDSEYLNTSGAVLKMFLGGGDCNPVTGVCTKTNGTAFGAFATVASPSAGILNWTGSAFGATYGVSGTGNVCLTISCNMTTPVLGAATATSINGLTLTASTGTLTVPNGVTLTGPAASGTAATLGNAETFGAKKTFTPSGTVAGLNVGALSGSSDPSSPVNGDVYYNSTLAVFRCYQNSAWANCIGTGGGSTGNATNPQTGSTYTYVTGDCNNIVLRSNASNMIDTLPQAGSTGFASGCRIRVVNNATGGMISYLTTTSTFNFNGSAGRALWFQGIDNTTDFISDGTNWTVATSFPQTLAVVQSDSCLGAVANTATIGYSGSGSVTCAVATSQANFANGSFSFPANFIGATTTVRISDIYFSTGSATPPADTFNIDLVNSPAHGSTVNVINSNAGSSACGNTSQSNVGCAQEYLLAGTTAPATSATVLITHLARGMITTSYDSAKTFATAATNDILQLTQGMLFGTATAGNNLDLAKFVLTWMTY